MQRVAGWCEAIVEDCELAFESLAGSVFDEAEVVEGKAGDDTCVM